MDYQKLADMLFPEVSKTPETLEAEFPPRSLPEGAVVTRMAPSPTGFVHLGNLVQGLTSERMAHQSGGVLFLRVEDTDQKREVAGAVETLINALEFYDIRFDEGVGASGDFGAYGPYRQRQRRDIYHVYAKKLTSEGKAYPCFCTEQELADIHAQQEKSKENFGYYGKYAVWRDRPLEQIEAQLSAGTPWVLRFRSEGSVANKIKFTDLIKGALELTENDIDHVLLKSDGIPTYHFAHAVDDHLMRTTHVVRGDEWLPSLPFHLQLFAALGWRPPKYLHIGPLMKMDGESKRKLSKRKDPELALTFYEQAGFPVRSVYEYLMGILNSNFEDWRRANPELPASDFKFSYKKMNPAGSLFDENKLRDVSKDVLARMSAQEVYELECGWAEKYSPEFFKVFAADPEYSQAALSIGRGGKKPRKDFATLAEIPGYLSFFYEESFAPEYEAEVFEWPVPGDDAKKIAREWQEICGRGEMPENGDDWFALVKRVGERFGYCPDTKLYKSEPEKWKGSVGDVSMVLRIATCGRRQSPDLFSVMHIMGNEAVARRMNRAILSIR